VAEQVSTLADLRPGDLGFGPISGIAGVGVRVGELTVAPFDHWPTWRSWRKVAHCGTVTEAATPGWTPTVGPLFDGQNMSHGPKFAQAMPSGFEIVTMGAEHWTADWIYLRPNYAPPMTGTRYRTGEKILLGVGQADNVAAIAQRMARKEIRYGFEDYAAIAVHRAGIHPKDLDDFIARVDPDGDPFRAICSQAVDGQLTLSGGLSGGHVFADGRLPQDVTPSELFIRVLEIGVAYVFRPGVS
jgi:hypothetical protein